MHSYKLENYLGVKTKSTKNKNQRTKTKYLSHTVFKQ